MGHPDGRLRRLLLSDPGVGDFRVLGTPIEDEPKFHALVTDLLQGADVGRERDTPEGQTALKKAAESTQELATCVRALVERLARESGRGVNSAALHDNDGPDGPVSLDVAASNASLLLVAGHGSTVNTLSNCVMTLLRNPVPGIWSATTPS